MDSQWRQLAQWVAQSNRIAFFGGAGVSTESGIPDFRGVEGPFRQDREVPIERVLSIDFFKTYPQAYQEWFAQENAREGVALSATHRFLVEPEKRGLLSAIVTQSTDGLHQSAGSERIFELHGNRSRLLCMGCGRRFSIVNFNKVRTGTVPRCPSCACVVRLDAVFYGEVLGSGVPEGAVRAIADADMLIVAGMSLVVYPTAGLVDCYDGDRLMLVNAMPTPYDSRANFIIRDPVGKVFAELARAV